MTTALDRIDSNLAALRKAKDGWLGALVNFAAKQGAHRTGGPHYCFSETQRTCRWPWQMSLVVMRQKDT